jgi:hypothetical protein
MSAPDFGVGARPERKLRAGIQSGAFSKTFMPMMQFRSEPARNTTQQLILKLHSFASGSIVNSMTGMRLP